jgi:hypothetical protein
MPTNWTDLEPIVEDQPKTETNWADFEPIYQPREEIAAAVPAWMKPAPAASALEGVSATPSGLPALPDSDLSAAALQTIPRPEATIGAPTPVDVEGIVRGTAAPGAGERLDKRRQFETIKADLGYKNVPDQEFFTENPELKARWGGLSSTDMPVGRLTAADVQNVLQDARNGVPDFLKPLADKVTKQLSGLTAGTQNAVADFADFMTSAPGIMTALTGGVAAGAGGAGLTGIESAIHRTLAMGFGADMARTSPEQLSAIVDAAKRGDTAEATRATLGALMTLGVVAGGVKAARGGAFELTQYPDLRPPAEDFQGPQRGILGRDMPQQPFGRGVVTSAGADLEGEPRTPDQIAADATAAMLEARGPEDALAKQTAAASLLAEQSRRERITRDQEAARAAAKAARPVVPEGGETPPATIADQALPTDLKTFEDFAAELSRRGTGNETINGIRALFPEQRLSREAARSLGKAAFGDDWNPPGAGEAPEGPTAPPSGPAQPGGGAAPAAPEEAGTLLGMPLEYWKKLKQMPAGPSRARLAKSLGVEDTPSAIRAMLDKRIAEIEAKAAKPATEPAKAETKPGEPATPAEPTIESVSGTSPAEFFDLSAEWTKGGMAGTGKGPQLRAEAAARANPDLAAWQKAYDDAAAEAKRIRDEIKADPSKLAERQKEMMGAAQKAQFFSEGIKDIKKAQEASAALAAKSDTDINAELKKKLAATLGKKPGQKLPQAGEPLLDVPATPLSPIAERTRIQRALAELEVVDRRGEPQPKDKEENTTTEIGGLRLRLKVVERAMTKGTSVEKEWAEEMSGVLHDGLDPLTQTIINIKHLADKAKTPIPQSKLDEWQSEADFIMQRLEFDGDKTDATQKLRDLSSSIREEAGDWEEGEPIRPQTPAVVRDQGRIDWDNPQEISDALQKLHTEYDQKIAAWKAAGSKLFLDQVEPDVERAMKLMQGRIDELGDKGKSEDDLASEEADRRAADEEQITRWKSAQIVLEARLQASKEALKKLRDQGRPYSDPMVQQFSKSIEKKEQGIARLKANIEKGPNALRKPGSTDVPPEEPPGDSGEVGGGAPKPKPQPPTPPQGGQAKPPDVPPKKQPWEMTQKEFSSDPRTKAAHKAYPDKSLAAVHRTYVEKAIAAGKTVPPEVLEDYPDLKPKAPTEFPKHPDLPDKAKGEGGNIFKIYGDAVAKWEKAVAEWLKTKPENKPIVWEQANGNVFALTKNIGGDNPWRVTSFVPNKDGTALMPWGHREYKTREAAMIEEAQNPTKFHDSMPKRVMDEKEIQGYKTMDEVPDKSALTWYTVKGGKEGIRRLTERLRGITYMQDFVKDSVTEEGKVAFIKPVAEKDLEYLGLEKEKEKGKAQVGDTITFTPEDKKQTPTTGQVSEVIHNTEGQVGYQIISPLPGQPGRTVRVWDRDGTISKAAEKSVEEMLTAPVVNTVEARDRLKAIDRRQAELRDEKKKLEDQIKEVEKVIMTTRGRRYMRGGSSRIKASAPKSQVAKYRDLQKESYEIEKQLRALDDAAKSDRQLLDDNADAAIINDPKQPLLRRIDRKIRSMPKDPPPGLVAARDAERARLIREKYPDVTEDEIKRMGPNVDLAMYHARDLKDLWNQYEMGGNPTPHSLRRDALHAALNAPDVPKHLFPEELTNELMKYGAGDRVYGRQYPETEKLTPQGLFNLTKKIRDTSKRIHAEEAAKVEAAKKETAEREAAEEKLLGEAQDVADSLPKTGRPGAPSAETVNADLVSRIKGSIDDLLKSNPVKLTNRGTTDGITDYIAEGDESAAAMGTIERKQLKKGESFEVNAWPLNNKDLKIKATVPTLEEAEWLIKAMAASGKGKAVIGVPGDGVFRLLRYGPTLLKVWHGARGLETSGGDKTTPYKTQGGAEAPVEKITTIADWNKAKEYHGLEPGDKISTWSPALLDLAKRVNPKNPEAVDVRDVELKIKNKEKIPPAPDISVGPGAASPSDFPKDSFVAQMTKYLKAGRKDFGPVSPKVTLAQRIRNALGFADRISKGKSAVWNGLARTRAASATMLDNYLHQAPWRDFDASLGRWDGADQQSSFEIREWVKEINKNFPKDRQEALTNWIQADGDPALLQHRADELRRRGFNKLADGYERALDLNDEEKTWARQIQIYLDERLEEGMNAGLIKQGVEDYITQIWNRDNPTATKLRSEFGNVLNPDFRFARQRVFSSYFEGEMAGFEPKNKSVGYLISTYDQAFNRSLSARAFIKELHEGRAADGKPLVMTTGKTIPIITGQQPPEAYLIKPHVAPEGAVAADGRPYRVIDHWALRDWKWALEVPPEVNPPQHQLARLGDLTTDITEGIPGAPVFVQGDMVVHPDIYNHLRNVLTKSRLQEYGITKAALKLSAFAKQTKLSLSVFHLDQEGLHGFFHRINPANTTKIDFADPKQWGLVRHGLMVSDPRFQELFSEGLSGGGLVGKIPGLGHTQVWFNDFLFRDYIPRLKMSMALDALERNRKTYAKEIADGRISDDQIQALTAREANAAFGELNYRQMGRNPTLQDFLRLSLLAPDFLEARSRFVGQALKPYGREQQVALALMGATLYVGARIANQMLDGDPHWNKPFSVIYKDREYRLRTVLGDVAHLWTDPRTFFYNRLSPITRAATEVITRRDDRGIKRTSIQQLEDLTQWLVPIPFQRWKEGAVQSVLGSAGAGSAPFTPRKQVQDMARNFMAKSANPQIQKEYQRRETQIFGESIYKPLRAAIERNDMQSAANEVRNLVQNEPNREAKLKRLHEILNAFNPTSVSGIKPLATHNRVIEKLFIQSLDDRGRQTYKNALRQQAIEYRRVRQAMGLDRTAATPSP